MNVPIYILVHEDKREGSNAIFGCYVDKTKAVKEAKRLANQWDFQPKEDFALRYWWEGGDLIYDDEYAEELYILTEQVDLSLKDDNYAPWEFEIFNKVRAIKDQVCLESIAEDLGIDMDEVDMEKLVEEYEAYSDYESGSWYEDMEFFLQRKFEED